MKLDLLPLGDKILKFVDLCKSEQIDECLVLECYSSIVNDVSFILRFSNSEVECRRAFIHFRFVTNYLNQTLSFSRYSNFIHLYFTMDNESDNRQK